jgi:hypothetical protein
MTGERDMNEEGVVTLRIRKRPWYRWGLWGVWLGAEIFLAQNAIASGSELEPRAATIFWGMFIILLMAGVVAAFVQRYE